MTRSHFRLLLIGLALYWLTIFTATHLPPRDLPQIHVSDKIEHIGAFACLAILINTVLHARRARSADVLTLVIILAYGAVDEWSQIPVGRKCDLMDWCADSTGAALGTIISGLCRLAYHRLFPAAAPEQVEMRDITAP